jgi:hypothetical protein
VRKPLVVLATLLAPAIVHAQEATPNANELPPEEKKPEKPTGIVIPVSIMGGIRAGGAINLGKNAPDGLSSKPNDAIAAADLALELGSLVWNHIYAGFLVGGTFFISPSSTTSDVRSLVVATEFGWLTNATGFGAYFGLGVGYRATYVTDAVGNANKFDGAEGIATVALHAKLGTLVRVLPRLDFSAGPSGSGQAHAIFTLGVSLWLNDDVHPSRKKHTAAP